MVESAQNRRRDDPNVFGEAMAVRPQLAEVRHRIGNPRSQAGVGTTPIVVGHPFTKDPSEMSLVDGDEPVETLAAHRTDQSFTEGVGVSRQLHRRQAVRPKPFELLIPSIRCVAGRSS
jgi:hypothetical protein